MTLKQLNQSLNSYAASLDGTAATKRALHETIGATNAHRHDAMSARFLKGVWSSQNHLRPFDVRAAVRRQALGTAALAREFEVTNRVRREFEWLERLRREDDAVSRAARFAMGIAAMERQMVASYAEAARGVEAYASTLRPGHLGLNGILQSRRAPWVSASSALNRASTPFHAGIVDAATAIHQAFRSWQTAFDWADRLRGYVHWEAPSIAHFGPLCRYLSNQSWLVSCEVLLVLNLDHYDWHRREQREEIMARLCDHYHAYLNEIESELAAHYPGHGHQIASAFNNHRRQDFASSIPCMFTIAEAIARARWQAPYFCFWQQRQIVVDRLGPLRDRPEQPYLIPLYYRGGLRRNSNLVQPTDLTLNRHAVDHGSRGDMDTEANSLRCVALLDYLHSLAADFQQPLPTA